MVLAMGLVPSHAEQQLFDFYVNNGSTTGCCASYHGSAYDQNHAPPGGFLTSSSAAGAISEASGNGHGVHGGAVTQTLYDAYDGYGGVSLTTAPGVRTTTNGLNFGGLTVTRDVDATHGPGNATTAITTPFTNAGVPNAARFIETITNNTGATISGYFQYENNLGSDSNTRFVTIGPNNTYLTSIQAGARSDPVLTFVFGNNAYTKNSVVLVYANGNDNPSWNYPISVLPGQTISIATFAIITGQTDPNNDPTSANDIALGAQLASLITNNGNPLSLNSPFFTGMTTAQLRTLINWDFLFAFTPTGTNANQNNVVNAINGVLNGGGDIGGLSALYGLSGNQFNNALSQLSGETATGSQNTAFESGSAFLGLMMNPFNEGRDTFVETGEASGYADEASDDKNSTKSKAEKAFARVLKAPPVTRLDGRWAVWGSAYGGYGTASGDNSVGSVNTTTQVYGVSAGVDYHFDPSTKLGFALAGGGGAWSLDQNRGSGRTDVFQLGLYGTHTIGPWYVSLAGAFGAHDVTTKRDVTIAGTTGSYDADYKAFSVGGRLESGYKLTSYGLGVTPYAAVQSQLFHTPSYSENTTSGISAYALSFSSQSTTATRTELGSWFDYKLRTQNPTTLYARASWAHDYNTDRSISAIFQTVPGASFVVNGASTSPDTALLSAGARVAMVGNWSVDGRLDGEFGRTSTSYAGNLTFKKTW
jgi:uncharacterized protein with beta-barrel porin domain